MVGEKEQTIGAMAQSIEQLVGKNQFHCHTVDKPLEPFDQLRSEPKSHHSAELNLPNGMSKLNVDTRLEEIPSADAQLKESFVKCYTRYPRTAPYPVSYCPVMTVNDQAEKEEIPLICKEEFERAKLAAQKQQFNEEMISHQHQMRFAREFNGIKTCPIMNLDERDKFLQYKQQYMESIRELVTDEEIKEWESVEKGWEKYQIGPYGYFGDFGDQNSQDEKLAYSREHAIHLYKIGQNLQAIQEFRKAGLHKLDTEAIICYCGALAGENYLSDVEEIVRGKQDLVSQFFQLYCSKKYKECIRLCDLLLSKEEDEQHKYYLNMKANAYSKLGQYQLALKQISLAIELDEKIPKFHTNKAILMMKCGLSKKEYMEPLEKALSMLPEHLKPALLEIEHILNNP